MQTIVIENREKEFELVLEHDKDGVSRAVITYRTPLPLYSFINCGAVVKIGGCGPGIQVGNSYPSDSEGRPI